MLTTLAASLIAVQSADRLPDLKVLPERIADAYVTTSNPELPNGTRALRFSTGSLNAGPGRLEMRGAEVVGNKQRVNQRVFRWDGTFYDREAGWFIYHAGHGHIHFEDWTTFKLRQMLPDGGAGAYVGAGTKTSFCIIEISDYDTSVAGHYDPPAYNSCGQVQGLRQGWADIYGSTLTGQYIELTGIPDGIYWLEGEIDPNHQVLETNEFNNLTRIPIGIGTPPNTTPDPYEPNNSMAEVDGKPIGGATSANFGFIRQRKDVRNLSMSDAADWFKFSMLKPGNGAYVKMESPWMRQGDLNLELYNSSGQLVKSSANTYNFTQISLKGMAGGTYYVRAVRNGTTNNPLYYLTIDLQAKPVSGVTLNDPAEPAWYEKSHDFIPVSWFHSNKQTIGKQLTMLRSRTMDEADATEIDGYQNLDPLSAQSNLNTVQFGYGKWYILARCTNGESYVDSWAPAPVYVYKHGDPDYDGHVTHEEANQLLNYLISGTTLPEGWNEICDMNHDENVDFVDVRLMHKVADEGDDHHDGL